MNITINISDGELSPDDKKIIKDCLHLASDPELEIALSKLCKASFLEYCKMFKEKGLPTRADEVQQERLFFLFLYYFENRIPFENDISSIFQITQSQSKTLLRNTNSRFRTKISSYLRNTLKTIIETGRFNDDSEKWEITITSNIMLEEINMIVTQTNAVLKPLTKKRGYSNIYECPEDTYETLLTEFDLN